MQFCVSGSASAVHHGNTSMLTDQPPVTELIREVFTYQSSVGYKSISRVSPRFLKGNEIK